jgi:hypothetical protein
MVVSVFDWADKEKCAMPKKIITDSVFFIGVCLVLGNFLYVAKISLIPFSKDTVMFT